MTTTTSAPAAPTRARLGAVCLAVAGLLFLLYPAIRPYNGGGADTAAQIGSSAWVIAHLLAIVAFILVPLGWLALRNLVDGSGAERLAFAALVAGWVGAGLTLPYYGGEDFALNAAAKHVPADQLTAVVEAFRYGTAAVTTFAIGLVLLAVSAILAAIVVWRSGVLPKYSGIALAVAFALYIPQYFTPPPFRIAYGVLMALGGLWLAWAMWRAEPVRPR